MKIVLVNTPIVEKTPYAFRYNEYLLMPLGILSLGTMLKTKGHDVKVIDAYVEQLSVNGIVERVFAADPDVVGIGMITPTYPTANKLVFNIATKRKNKRPLVVIGGTHATLLPEKTLLECSADFLIRGEGEESLVKLVDALANSGDLSHIPGICFKKDGAIHQGPENAGLQNPDGLPPLDYSLLNMELYRAPLQWTPPRRTYNIMTTRGCPFNCPYCANKSLRRGISHHSIERIHREVEILISKYDCRRLMIYDSVFPSHRKKGLEFIKMMIESGFHRKVHWFFQTRVELLDEEFVALAKRAGCSRISLGVESGDPDILKSINKHFTPEDAIRASKMVRKHGIWVSANFIFGHIGDTLESMKRTAGLSRAMDIDEATFYFLTPYPGTKTFERANETRDALSGDWQDYLKSGKFIDRKVAFVPEGLSEKQLIAMRRSAFLKFYLRPKIICRDFLRMGAYYFTLKYLLKASTLFHGFLLDVFINTDRHKLAAVKKERLQ
jgi:radical SAM superfamily enzyme YgiQ (UPF0313 family)